MQNTSPFFIVGKHLNAGNKITAQYMLKEGGWVEVEGGVWKSSYTIWSLASDCTPVNSWV